MGRSGTPFWAAALALLCSAIFSFSALRAAPAPTDLENEDALVWDEASEAFGLLGSFSSAVFSRFSSVSNILVKVSSALCGYGEVDSRFGSLRPYQSKGPVSASISLAHFWVSISDTFPDNLLQRI